MNRFLTVCTFAMFSLSFASTVLAQASSSEDYSAEDLRLRKYLGDKEFEKEYPKYRQFVDEAMYFNYGLHDNVGDGSQMTFWEYER